MLENQVTRQRPFVFLSSSSLCYNVITLMQQRYKNKSRRKEITYFLFSSAYPLNTSARIFSAQYEQMRKARAIIISILQRVAQQVYGITSQCCVWSAITPLLCMARIAAFSVGAATSNSTTSSAKDIHTLICKLTKNDET